MSILDLLTLALATLYLSYALTKTHGPFGVFSAIRQRASLGGLTSCIVCAAFWLALAFYALWLTPLKPIVEVFAVAGGMVALAQYTGLKQEA